ncbi:NAD(P)-binding protein [Mycena venus]|uniref:NAD(P)-binding protein n=1 Tax=Mycena venus TaxID=2733690 RepID=A0A8H6XIU8_9AGAR|nr:NAD(P)-binding protein [Mycena venus]
MPVNAAAALQNVSLAGQNKTAAVVGGTRGIGGGVARLLAKIGCSRIIILGRNEKQGKETVEVLKRLAPKGSNIAAEFIQGDLSDNKGINAVATSLQEIGDTGIDYLILCQNGSPAGLNIKDNDDGHDTAFAIQCISRVALAYTLTTRGGLAQNAIVMSICNQGQSLDDLSVDDLSLKTRLAAGPSAPALFMQQSKRDSTVLDSCFERYYSLFPGLVKTEEFDPNFAPGYIKWVMWLGIKLIGVSPDDYAHYPVYILASPKARSTLGSGKYFGRRLDPTPLGKWSQDPKNRKAMWEKMMQIIGEN